MLAGAVAILACVAVLGYGAVSPEMREVTTVAILAGLVTFVADSIVRARRF